jgi:hypothetical protein
VLNLAVYTTRSVCGNTRRPLQLTHQITTLLCLVCQTEHSAFFSSLTDSQPPDLFAITLTRPTAKPHRRISRQPTVGPKIKGSCQTVYRADGLVSYVHQSSELLQYKDGLHDRQIGLPNPAGTMIFLFSTTRSVMGSTRLPPKG